MQMFCSPQRTTREVRQHLMGLVEKDQPEKTCDIRIQTVAEFLDQV